MKAAASLSCWLMFWGSLCLLAPSPVMAAEYYLSPTGNDSTGNGSMEHPFQTLAHVETLLAAGDTVTLRAGTYVSNVFRIRYPHITIQSYKGEQARIQAPTTDEDIGMAIYVDVNAAYTTLSRLEIMGGYYYGVKTESTWNWGGGEPLHGASHLTISDCSIHHTGRDAIKLVPLSDDALIQRCEIHTTGVRDTGNAEGIDNVNADRMVVRECYLHDIATTGIYAKGGATDCVIDRCLIMNTGGLGVALGFDTSVEWFDAAVNPGYYENIRGQLSNSIIVGTRYAGVGLYAAYQPGVYNNTVVDAAQSGQQSALFFGSSWKDWDTSVPHHGCVEPVITNNIFAVAAGLSPAPLVLIRHETELGGFSALEGDADLSNNIYFAPTKTASFEDRRSGFTGGLAAWKTHMHSDNNSLETDPQLTTQYHLQASSPAIGAGVSVNESIFDYDGSRRNIAAPVDIGADEFISGVLLPVPPPEGTIGIGTLGASPGTPHDPGSKPYSPLPLSSILLLLR
ncbi:MAG: hypothetical protein CSA34_07210 [Desulfobulbus propionicus]|nr:MAG: hypothetical protein CSA34_07210 [Desulfobulbus propionicus]